MCVKENAPDGKNMKKNNIFFIASSLLLTMSLNAYDSFKGPWSVKRAEKIVRVTEKITERPNPAVGSPLKVMMMTVNGFYQKNLSAKRTQHCPCYPSCSAYCKQSVKKYGAFFGLLMITDRMFYRENSSMYLYYPTVKKSGQSRFLDLPEADYIFHKKMITPDGGIKKYEKN